MITAKETSQRMPDSHTHSQTFRVPGDHLTARNNGMLGVWQYFRKHRTMSIIAGHVIVMTVLAVIMLGGAVGPMLSSTFSQASCANTAQAHQGAAGGTSGIAACGSALGVSRGQAASAAGNPFPYGQCTWWADQRYYQVHGIFVPWYTNANAWQWVARAYEHGWHVSSQPTAGSIIVLQPWVQGAYNLGHVAFVERVLGNGRVLASNMNWGGSANIINVQFVAGPGVSFVYR